MSKPETVEQQWNDYSSRIFRGLSISEVQRNETKQAFYAGAYSILMTLRDVLGDDAISEDAGVQILENYKQELEKFHTSNLNRRTGFAN
jgi:hypothetical protein